MRGRAKRGVQGISRFGLCHRSPPPGPSASPPAPPRPAATHLAEAQPKRKKRPKKKNNGLPTQTFTAFPASPHTPNTPLPTNVTLSLLGIYLGQCIAKRRTRRRRRASMGPQRRPACEVGAHEASAFPTPQWSGCSATPAGGQQHALPGWADIRRSRQNERDKQACARPGQANVPVRAGRMACHAVITISADNTPRACKAQGWPAPVPGSGRQAAHVRT